MTEAHAVALKAALNSAMSPLAAYDFDAPEAKTAPNHVQLAVGRRFGGESRESGVKTASGWRATTRVVARTVTNARAMLDDVRTGLEFKMLTIGGEVTTPIQFESEDPIGPDDGAYSGLVTWTYVLP